MNKKIIFFELNEVPWRIVEDFVRDYPASKLAMMLPQMTKFRTHTEDKNLSPWVTWPTVHRGVDDAAHAISDFGQDLSDVDEEHPPIWELLVRNGVSTGVFGSFHTYPLPKDVERYDFYVPDVFAAGSECFPKKFEAFQNFNLTMSRASARSVQGGIPIGAAAKFLFRLPGLGLKPRTAFELASQLVDERRENWKRIRRRTYQVTLAFDLFMKELNRSKPDFVTFFTNHVASSMHRYWAAKYPSDYDVFGYSDDWKRTYDHEIDWTVGKFDEMLGRLRGFVRRNSEYALWILSSMGQAATRADNPTTTQVYLNDLSQFMSYFGIKEDEFEKRPTMLPRITVRLEQDKVAGFEAKTADLKVGGEFKVECENLGKRIFAIRPPVIQNRAFDFCTSDGDEVPFSDLGFENVEIDDMAGMTAYHIRQGTMFIWDPTAPATDQSIRDVATVEVAPMLLENFGVAKPDYMT